MNRILQADVILTLTADQARAVLAALDSAMTPDCVWELFGVVSDQCAKQGVQL